MARLQPDALLRVCVCVAGGCVDVLAAAAARCVARDGRSQYVSEALYLCGLSETALCVV